MVVEVVVSTRESGFLAHDSDCRAGTATKVEPFVAGFKPFKKWLGQTAEKAAITDIIGIILVVVVNRFFC